MNKEKRYLRLIEQIKSLTTEIDTPISRMATINAILYHKMNNFFWTGFYLLEDGKLRVGPYQGPLACLQLKKDTGVCWHAINKNKTVVVPNVKEFQGHIACDTRSKSEIVVLLKNKKNEIIGVLDIDSEILENFDNVDAFYLEQITNLVFE